MILLVAVSVMIIITIIIIITTIIMLLIIIASVGMFMKLIDLKLKTNYYYDKYSIAPTIVEIEK